MKEPYKIFADFNNADAHGRLRLKTQGSLNDIKEQNIVREPGMMVQVNDYDEFSISGMVEFQKKRIYG